MQPFLEEEAEKRKHASEKQIAQTNGFERTAFEAGVPAATAAAAATEMDTTWAAGSVDGKSKMDLNDDGAAQQPLDIPSRFDQSREHGLGKKGRKSPAARRAEAMLVAAKQAWRRAETAQAQAKRLHEELEAAPLSDRQRLSFRAAEAADEARAAKAAWQDALAKAERGMEEAKKTIDRR